jgi:hypothetical protein
MSTAGNWLLCHDNATRTKNYTKWRRFQTEEDNIINAINNLRVIP